MWRVLTPGTMAIHRGDRGYDIAKRAINHIACLISDDITSWDPWLKLMRNDGTCVGNNLLLGSPKIEDGFFCSSLDRFVRTINPFDSVFNSIPDISLFYPSGSPIQQRISRDPTNLGLPDNEIFGAIGVFVEAKHSAQTVELFGHGRGDGVCHGHNCGDSVSHIV